MILFAAGTLVLACLLANGAGAQTAKQIRNDPSTGRGFSSPHRAAQALIDAAERSDLSALKLILGPAGHDIVDTGDPVQDRELARAFALKARQKQRVTLDPGNPARAYLSVGQEDWPFPVPIVKRNGRWFFDSKAGSREILLRRVGRNELDVIQTMHGYVEAQREYAMTKRTGSNVNQFAQRIISTPGQQDGLAWQNPDGTWGGPIGEEVARAIERGYSDKTKPFHGYLFRVLKGQGPDAPSGQMDYVVNGAMTGGFALVASPAEYGVTGVKTFIVSNHGVVYEKDLGPNTLTLFNQMDRFNPDKSWRPVKGK